MRRPARRSSRGERRACGAPRKSRRTRPSSRRPACFQPSRSTSICVAPNNLVVRGQRSSAGRPDAGADRNMNATVGIDMQIQKEPDAPLTLRGKVRHRSRLLRVPGPAIRDRSRRNRPVPRPAGDQSTARHHRAAADPQHRRHRHDSRHGQDALAGARADQRSAARRSRHPVADHFQSLRQRSGHRRTRLAGGNGRRHRERVRRLATRRSIGKALDVDLFEITTSDPQTGETAGGVTLGKQISDKAFVRFRQQFGQRSFTEFMLEYQLASVPAPRHQRRARDRRRRQPPDPAPRGARRGGFDFLLQLLKQVRGSGFG